MSASDHLSPQQFDNDQRRDMLRTAKSVPGTEAPVFYANPSDRYIPNPLAAHLSADNPAPASYRGKEGYYERPRRVESVPLNRLESSQGMVSRTHLNNMARRKGQAPPIEVVHHTDSDRYVVSEGNHRSLVALKRGDEQIRAAVTKFVPWSRPS